MMLGMPTLIETPTLEECANLCRTLGLGFIELNMNLPQYQLNKIHIPHFQAVAQEHGLYYTIHLDENLDPFDFNPYVAQAYRRTVQETIELAKALHAPILNIHWPRGVYFTLPDRRVYLFEEYRAQYLQSVAQFRDMCQSAIGDSGIKICIENCDGYLPFQKEAIEILLESSAFFLTFDVGHDHGIGGQDAPFITEHLPKLAHMHIHDALGRQNHLALGAGEIDLPACFALANAQNCRAVLETKTIGGLKQSVQWVIDHILSPCREGS